MGTNPHYRIGYKILNGYINDYFMKRAILIVSILIFISGCKEVKRQIEKFTFDESKVTFVSKYYYKYDSNRKILETEKNYTYYSNKIVDSMVTVTTFIYGKKGLLEKKVSKNAFEKNPDIEFFTYDSIDSLRVSLNVESRGDTVGWHEYKNYPDGKKEIFLRVLLVDSKSYEEYGSAYENKIYDTILIKREYIYEDNLCKELKIYDNKNKLSGGEKYEYQDGRVSKASVYVLLDSIKVLKMTRYYDYLLRANTPDYYSINFLGDTVEKCTNEFDYGDLILTTTVYGHNDNILKIFYENGKKIGDVSYSKITGNNSYNAYTYYKNGDLKETKHYLENATKKH